jgi:hypothetical protein
VCISKFRGVACAVEGDWGCCVCVGEGEWGAVWALEEEWRKNVCIRRGMGICVCIRRRVGVLCVQ